MTVKSGLGPELKPSARRRERDVDRNTSKCAGLGEQREGPLAPGDSANRSQNARDLSGAARRYDSAVLSRQQLRAESPIRFR